MCPKSAETPFVSFALIQNKNFCICCASNHVCCQDYREGNNLQNGACISGSGVAWGWEYERQAFLGKIWDMVPPPICTCTSCHQYKLFRVAITVWGKVKDITISGHITQCSSRFLAPPTFRRWCEADAFPLKSWKHHRIAQNVGHVDSCQDQNQPQRHLNNHRPATARFQDTWCKCPGSQGETTVQMEGMNTHDNGTLVTQVTSVKGTTSNCALCGTNDSLSSAVFCTSFTAMNKNPKKAESTVWDWTWGSLPKEMISFTPGHPNKLNENCTDATPMIQPFSNTAEPVNSVTTIFPWPNVLIWSSTWA